MSTIKTSPDSITTGGGKLFIAPYDKETGEFGTEVYFGITDNVEMDASTDYIEKPYTEEAVQSIAKKIAKKQNATLKFSTAEISPEMLARAYGGSIVEETQSAVTDVTVTIANPKKGGFYELGYVKVTKAEISSLTEGVDFRVDYGAGRVEFLTDGSLDETQASIDVTVSAEEYTKINMEALTKGALEAKLIFVSEPLIGSRFKYTFHKVTISASGSFALKSDDFASLEFEGTVSAFDTGKDGASKFYLIEQIPEN